jgi:hypothetical protein
MPGDEAVSVNAVSNGDDDDTTTALGPIRMYGWRFSR